MNTENEMKRTGVKLNRRWLWLGAAILIVAGIGAVWFWQSANKSRGAAGRPVPRVETTVPAATSDGGRDADLTLPQEMIDRIQLKYGEATTQSLASSLRTTATVQPNAYRETPVLPLVDGRVTNVKVQLGDTVKEGQVLATIFSAELAEAQMKYLTVDANLQFHISQSKRFERLADLGAVSRQELEEVVSRLREHHAEHASLKERMLLYGLTEHEIVTLKNSAQVRSDVPVHAPASGIITNRDINVGQNLTMRDRLFTITDLSTVWIIANIYEKDFVLLRPGTAVTIASQAYPGRSWQGRISYIDPRIDQETRTAQVRIEVPNQNQLLKLGMFVDVTIKSGGTEQALVAPKSAVQTIGIEQVVFLPLGEGRFEMRKVILGEESGDLVRIASGLNPGEKVVTEGSFFLRAEIGRR